MSLVRRFARPLLAASFISGGIDTLRNPGPRVPAAEKVVSPLVEKVPQLSNVEQVVKIDAAIKVVAGTLFALGKFPRLSAAALIASLVPTTAAGHRFWEESDPAKRKHHQVHFLKNAGIVGGLMLAAVDTEGRPSLAWRAQHAPRALSHAANDLRRDAELALHSASGTLTAGALRTAGGAVTGTLHSATDAVSGTLHSATDAVSGGLHSATDSLRSAAEGVRDRLPA
jgi:putative oxidoreductase